MAVWLQVKVRTYARYVFDTTPLQLRYTASGTVQVLYMPLPCSLFLLFKCYSEDWYNTDRYRICYVVVAGGCVRMGRCWDRGCCMQTSRAARQVGSSSETLACRVVRSSQGPISFCFDLSLRVDFVHRERKSTRFGVEPDSRVWGVRRHPRRRKMRHGNLREGQK